MKNMVQCGRFVTVPAPEGGVTSGDFVVVGKIAGVACASAAAGAAVVLDTCGIFELPKYGAGGGADWAQGDQVYWDAGNARFTNVSGENLSYGTAAAAATSAATLGLVRIGYPMPLVGPGAQQAAIADLGGVLTGETDGALADIAAAAGACAGGATPSAANVDAAIATAVATIVAGVNLNLKELQAKLNDVIAKLRLAGTIEDA